MSYADRKKRKTSEDAIACGNDVVFTKSQEETMKLVKTLAAEKGGSSANPIALPSARDGTPRGKKVRKFYENALGNAKESATCGEKTKKKARYILKLYKKSGYNVNFDWDSK